MDRIAIRSERGLDDDVIAQVAVGRGPGADANRAVGGAGGESVAVGLGGANDALQAERSAGLDNSQRDFPSVRDEHPVHAGETLNSGWPYSTSSAFSLQTSTTVPLTP